MKDDSLEEQTDPLTPGLLAAEIVGSLEKFRQVADELEDREAVEA
jgi:hypothetical protein